MGQKYSTPGGLPRLEGGHYQSTAMDATQVQNALSRLDFMGFTPDYEVQEQAQASMDSAPQLASDLLSTDTMTSPTLTAQLAPARGPAEATEVLEQGPKPSARPCSEDLQQQQDGLKGPLEAVKCPTAKATSSAADCSPHGSEAAPKISSSGISTDGNSSHCKSESEDAMYRVSSSSASSCDPSLNLATNSSSSCSSSGANLQDIVVYTAASWPEFPALAGTATTNNFVHRGNVISFIHKYKYLPKRPVGCGGYASVVEIEGFTLVVVEEDGGSSTDSAPPGVAVREEPGVTLRCFRETWQAKQMVQSRIPGFALPVVAAWFVPEPGSSSSSSTASKSECLDSLTNGRDTQVQGTAYFLYPLAMCNVKEHIQQLAADGQYLPQPALEVIAASLLYMVYMGVWHGDIKPHNMVIDHRGRVRMIDCGGAADALKRGQSYREQVDTSREYGVSPEYACIWRLQSGEVTTLSELASIGQVLLECSISCQPYEELLIEWPVDSDSGSLGGERALWAPKEDGKAQYNRALDAFSEAMTGRALTDPLQNLIVRLLKRAFEDPAEKGISLKIAMNMNKVWGTGGIEQHVGGVIV